MEAILVNYNFDPTWLLDHPELKVVMYDRSDDGVERRLEQYGKVIKRTNVGQVDFDKLSYLVENYDRLPDVFLWGKTNLWKFITPEEYEKVAQNKGFTALLTAHHETYSDGFGIVNKYDKGIYWERNDDWYFGSFLKRYVNSFKEWAEIFNLPNPPYLPFAPGGNYILTKETVHKHPKALYDKMRMMLPYTREPVEAQCAERSYYLLWA